MGSDSDLDVMAGAYEALEELGFAEQTEFESPPESRFTSRATSSRRTERRS
jgi:hypothetical protein